jgi:POT family proton-dependent oligopeptide transporter
VLTPVIEWAVKALNRRRQGAPIGPIHMLLIGLLLSSAAAALLRIGAAGSARGVSVAWLLGFYLLITVGELLVNPIGTALVARLAPQRLRGFLLGVWLLSSSVGGFVSGQIGRVAWPALSHSGYFAVLAGVGLAGAALVALLWRPLSRLVGSGQPPKELEAVQRWEAAGKQIAKLRLVPKMRKAA